MHANRPLPLNAAHKPTLLCCTNIVTLGGLWTNCEHLASGGPLAYAWQSLGNKKKEITCASQLRKAVERKTAPLMHTLRVAQQL